MRKLCIATSTCTLLAAASLPALVSSALMSSAWANENIEYPADLPGYPFARSYPSGQAICIPPYERPFPVRIYTTPQQQPYYNVPPYSVITGY